MSRRDISIALALVAAFSGCTCSDIAGPDAQLREAARGLEQLRAVPEAGLSISRLQVTRITPEPDLDPQRVVFSFDLDGSVQLDGGAVAVSAIGVERVPMKREGGRYVPAGAALPQLAESLRALARESPPARRWLLRVDVGKVQVTEELADGTRRSTELGADR